MSRGGERFRQLAKEREIFSGDKQAIRKEWADSVTSLIDKLAKWLKDGKIDHQYIVREIDEWPIGAYSAPTIHINVCGEDVVIKAAYVSDEYHVPVILLSAPCRSIAILRDKDRGWAMPDGRNVTENNFFDALEFLFGFVE